MNQQNLGSKRSAAGGAGKIAAKSQEAAEQWKDAVVEQANQVREKAQSAKDHATDRIREVGVQLHQLGENLRDGDPLVADFAERASRGVERVANYVSSSSPQSFVRDAERMARRQPVLTFGSAFFLGLAAGRLLKSSAPGAPLHSSDDRAEGGALASRQDRTSGFYPSAEGADRTTRRYKENYDAAFGRDMPGDEPKGRPATEYGSAGRETEGGSGGEPGEGNPS